MAWRLPSANASVIAGPAWSGRRVAVASIAGIWAVYLVFVATRLALIGFPRERLLLERHLLTALVGGGMMSVLYLVLRRMQQASVVLRIVAALLLAAPAAGLLAPVNFEFLYVLAPGAIWPGHQVHHLRGIFARTILEIYFVFAGWGTLYTSVSSALESQEARRRAAVLEAETQAAQLRALRYQLNPHFLFNTLNTISALVMRGDPDGAEEAIQALSQFLRASLGTEAAEDTTLAEEMNLQRLYLGIEQVRFGERLHVRWSVPERLRPALLPPLLLQPLVENVIRHAVAPARRRVTMEVGASTEASRLHLLVQDDGPGVPPPSAQGSSAQGSSSQGSSLRGPPFTGRPAMGSGCATLPRDSPPATATPGPAGTDPGPAAASRSSWCCRSAWVRNRPDVPPCAS